MADKRLELEQSWATLRDRVENALASYIEQLSDDCPPRLRDSMAYSLMAGGKRLRPVLVLLAVEACGGSIDEAMPAACAIEMVHTYSLVHDDLPAMDDDDLRRGRPTNHIEFDEATAILAGDGLLTWAVEIVSSEISPPETAARCVTLLAQASGPTGMVGGQMSDLEAETGGIRSAEHLESIHRRKTGCLLTAALEMGAAVAGAGPAESAGLQEYGRCLGLAFQIADDLLDLVGHVDKMGKGVRKDSSHGKLTYPALLGLDESRSKAAALVETACEQLNAVGERGQTLRELAQFVIERDH